MSSDILTRQIHSDFPVVPLGLSNPFKYQTPLFDIAYALKENSVIPVYTVPIRSTTRSLTIDEVDHVTRYYIEHNGRRWTPGSGGGSELVLTLVAKLTDGWYVSVEAWNDYTGWGCQDGVEIRIGETEDDVVRYGLTREGRQRLGYDPS